MTQFPGRDDSPVQVLFSTCLLLPIKVKNKIDYARKQLVTRTNGMLHVLSFFFYCLVFDNEIINQIYTDSI